MESVSQLVLTIERLEGNSHLSPVVNGNGRSIKLFPAKFYCDTQKKFTSGVINYYLVVEELSLHLHLLHELSSVCSLWSALYAQPFHSIVGSEENRHEENPNLL